VGRYLSALRNDASGNERLEEFRGDESFRAFAGILEKALSG